MGGYPQHSKCSSMGCGMFLDTTLDILNLHFAIIRSNPQPSAPIREMQIFLAGLNDPE